MMMKNRLLTSSISFLFIVAVSTAWAADRVWTGTGGNDLWSNGQNWEGGTAPAGNADVAIFPASATPTAVRVDANTTIKTIYFRNPAGTTLTIDTGAELFCDNSGGLTIRAEENALINGPGTVRFSTNSGENYADNQAYADKTLTFNAKITGQHGFEHNGIGGTIILTNPANDYAGTTMLTSSGGISVPAIGNSGAPSTIGTGNAVKFTSNNGFFRYTGADASTDRAFYQNAGANTDAYIEHAGTGTLTFTGPFLSGNNNLHSFVFTIVDPAAAIKNTGSIENGGTGDLWLYKRGPGTQIMTAANTYTGPTILDAGTIALAPGAAISPDSLLRLRGGRLLLNADTPAATYTTTLGTLQVENADSTVQIAPAATSATVTFAGLTFVSGTVDVIADNLGSSTKIFITGLQEGLLGSWITVGGAFAYYSAADGLTAADLDTQTLAALGPSTIQNTPLSSARITETGTGGGIGLAADPTEIALLSQETATPATVTLGANTLIAPRIQLLPSAADLTVGSTGDTGALTINPSSDGSLYLHNDNPAASLTVRAAIRDNGDTPLQLAKTGPGTATVAGPLEHTGRTIIDQGTLVIDTAAATRDIATSGIIGNGNLTITGGGTANMPDRANSYTGATAIAGGTAVTIRNSATFGTTATPLVIEDGSTLDFIGSGTGNNTLRLGNKHVHAQGTGPDGLGALRNTIPDSNSQFWSLSHLTLTGDLTVYAPSRFDVRGDNAASTTVNLNGHGIYKKGAQLFGLTHTTVTNDQGTAFIDIQEGGVTLEENASLSGGSDNTIFIRSGAYFDLYTLIPPINWSVEAEENTRILTRQGASTDRNTLAGPITLNGRFTLDSTGAFIDTFTGPITGTGPLAKIGSNDSISYLLNENNTWSGGTAVSNGLLYVAAPGSLPGYATSLSVANRGGVVFRVAGDQPDENGWDHTAIESVLAKPGVFADSTTLAGFDTRYADFDYTSDYPHAGVRKLGPYSLTLSGAGPNLSAVDVYSGTLDFAGVSRDLGDNSLRIGINNPASESPASVTLDGNTAITTYDRGYNVGGQPSVTVGLSGRATLTLADNASIKGKMIIGDTATGAGAIYQTGGTFLNTGGAANDGRIGLTGYGYYLLAGGQHTTKGYSHIGRNPAAIGIQEQTGGTFISTSEYGGHYAISRGGTGTLHLSGGELTQDTSFKIGDLSDNDGIGGHATLTVTGTGTAKIRDAVDLNSRTNMTAILNLAGGTLLARNIHRIDTPSGQSHVNWNGGTLLATNAAQTELFTGGAAGLPEVTVHDRGAVIDIPAGAKGYRASAPLRAPEKLMIASIPVATPGAGYIGAPFVKIEGGGGQGASAFARFNRESGTVESIEIVSPGSGFTTLPTVTLLGGGATTPATLGTPVMALASSGGFTKLGEGALTLAAANTYAGPTEVREGTLRLEHREALPPLSAVSVTGGTLDLCRITATELNKDGSGTFLLDSPVSLNPAPYAKPLTPGLWEGMIRSSWDTATPNPKQGIQLTTRAAIGGQAPNGTYAGGIWAGDNHTWVYTGYIWNRSATNETWTFRGRFDDNISLAIDGNRLIDHNNGSAVTVNHTLTPGPHPIEIRFGDGSGDAGPGGSEKYGLSYDPLGRNSDQIDDYILIEDPGDGSLLTLDIPDDPGAGLRESLILVGWDTVNDGVPTGIQLTTRAGNGAITANGTYNDGIWKGGKHTWVYKGYIWNRTDQNQTWTWRLTFDDNILLKIGEGENAFIADILLSEGIVYRTHTLTPGPHPIEIRFGDDGGNVGPAAGIGGEVSGLTYDPNGGGDLNANPDASRFMILRDDGTGALLTTDLDLDLDLDPPEYATLNINAGTILLDSANTLGLWEELIGDCTAMDRISPPSRTGDPQPTLRAVNGRCGANGYINDVYWSTNTTCIYSGYIWNRTGSDMPLTFAENFDDQVLLTIDGTNILNDTTWNNPTIGTHILTPGPHYFEARFYQGGGGAAGNAAGWWSNENESFLVDYQGRDEKVFSNFQRLESNNDVILTTTLVDPFGGSAILADTVVNIAEDGTLDLNGGSHTVALVTGTGTVANGTLAAGTVISPAGDDAIGTLALDGVSFASGVTYRLNTASGSAASDCLAATGTLDLSGLTIVPATDELPTATTYVIATATGGFTGTYPALVGFPEKYTLTRKNNELVLSTIRGTTVILR